MSELAEVYYRGPGPKVVCAASIDDRRNELPSLLAGLDRARDDGAVVQLYGHKPGVSFPVAKLEALLAGARARGLAPFTYDDLADGKPAQAGLALSFDDASIDEWAGIADLLDAYGAKVTFFVTRYHLFSAEQRALLRGLAERGHAIAGHTVNHLRAPDYAEDHGLAAYWADEVEPSLALLRADGYPTRTFAYPFGARTEELDRLLLDGGLELLRSVSWPRDGLVTVDPCPE